MISVIDDQGSLNTWGHIAYDELIWSKLINNLDDQDFEYDFTQKNKFNILIRIRTRPIQKLIRQIIHIFHFLQILLNNLILHFQMYSKSHKYPLQIFLEKLRQLTENWQDFFIQTNG